MRRALFPEAHLVVAESLISLGQLREAQQDYEAAETLYRESLAMQRRLLPDAHEQIIRTQHLLDNLGMQNYGHP